MSAGKEKMQYRNDRQKSPISILGYGCMRFTKKGNAIQLEKAEEEVMEAIRSGVNYFDTAYLYPGSEAAMGEILQRNHCREKIKIATKLPQYMVKKKDSIERYFQEEIRRLQTDYIDYYLMHMLTDISSWERLQSLGIEDWISEKKASGAIRNIGFSFHGNTEMFLKILDAYDWDFCQIQYNYMDETSQAGREGLQAAAQKGIPVIIMEPLRGGKLVNMLPEKAKKYIAQNEKKYSAPEWGLRWLWEQKEVTCVLSGMNSIDMVRENVRIASDVKIGEFSEKDHAFIESVKKAIQEKEKVNCTGCHYCMPCPKGVDIPLTFHCYNEMYTENKMSGRMEYMQTALLRKVSCDASHCVECGACEKHCPQQISIRQELKKANKKLRPWYIRAVTEIGRRWMHLH